MLLEFFWQMQYICPEATNFICKEFFARAATLDLIAIHLPHCNEQMYNILYKIGLFEASDNPNISYIAHVQ
jgi:hypothetical protein